MKMVLKALGIIIVGLTGFPFILSLFSLLNGNTNDNVIKLIIYSGIGMIIGIIIIASSSSTKDSTAKFDMQEFEEFKRYQEQQRQIYYRNANAQGKPISEYLMDDRTKLITYYDRMSQDYKSQLVNYADSLYRKYENQEYLNRK